MSDILFQPLGNPVAGGDNLESLADIDPRMTRTHYFDGRLLTAEDLERDQIYLDQRLREVGKALGTGVISGLELSFSTDPYRLTVEPGKAITAAGRVLHLGTQMTVNPGDKALISELNNGRYRRFNRGLYAVVLRYVDVPTDIAEVFPTDLGDRRGADYALVTESVQLGLVPLPLPLSSLEPLRLRARLMAELTGSGISASVIPEDSVALGVLAIAGDTPQWVDSELLRQPIRPETAHNGLQEDLYRQYQSLSEEITRHRAAGGLEQPFAASDYFSLIPPAGFLPPHTVDPGKGYQSYFPESFDVSVAPVRTADLELILKESMELPVIDLSHDTDVSIMILAPLSDKDYQTLSQQLVAGDSQGRRDIPFSDPLALRLYPSGTSHTLDTDASVWAEIWSRMDRDRISYVRRPVRAAETGISGIVLAHGVSVPEVPPKDNTDDDAEPEEPTEIEDEYTVFLRMVNVPALARLRPASTEEGEKAIKVLTESLEKDPASLRIILDILLLAERHYDPVIWQTLEQTLKRETLPKLRELLVDTPADISSTGKQLVNAGPDLGLEDSLVQQWKKLLSPLQ